MYIINKDSVSMKTFNEYIDMSMEINKLQEQVKTLKKALEFYADKKKVNQMINGTGNDFEEIDGIFHGGKLARKTLSKIGE